MGTHLIHDITMMSPLLDVGLELDLPGGHCGVTVTGDTTSCLQTLF